MRVTNEQAEIEIFCNTANSCSGCRLDSDTITGCPEYRCNDTDAYRDLLDARQQRDELLEALKSVIYTTENFGEQYAGRNARDKAKALISKL